MIGSFRRATRAALDLIDAIAGLPPRASYTWGGRTTPLPFIAFHIITLVRAISPLQWIKHFYRGRGLARTTTNSRRDFPASLTEWYFICLSACALLVARTDPPAPRWFGVWGLALGWWIVADCTVWIVYYLFLRYFIEGKFAAYHQVEYLLQFPLVAGLQCTVIAIMLDRPVMTIVDGLRGVGNFEGPTGSLLGICGVIYIGGALSVLIGALPPIRARGADGVAIIGGGEVTRERILPALRQMGIRSSEVTILDLQPMEIHGYKTFDGSQREICSKINRLGVPAIIATPTDTHLSYVASLAAMGVQFAVEKPLCSSAFDRRRINKNPRWFEDAFSLSYYVLEKALPLTYLVSRRDSYLPYLEDENGESVSADRVGKAMDSLGVLRSVEVRIMEAASRSPSGSDRAWTEQPPDGLDAFIETMIHPLHLVSLLIPHDAPFEIRGLEVARYGPRDEQVRRTTGSGIAPTFVDLSAEVSEAKVRIVVGKHIPPNGTDRGLLAEFENGRILCRFDERSAQITVRDTAEQTLTLRVPKNLLPYVVQMSLFRDFVDRGWGHSRFDDLDRQLHALELWEQVVVAGASTPVTTYNDHETVHPTPLFGDAS